MTELKVDRYPKDGALVVDSRLIAQELGVTHKAFMDTIRKYEKQTEQAFGGLRFETAVPEKPTGNPPQFVYLTEDQATFLMTLSRNTPEVVRCKVLLVTQFSQAKRLLAEQGYEQIPHTSIYIRRLEQTFDHNIDYDKWSTFKEGSEIQLSKWICVMGVSGNTGVHIEKENNGQLIQDGICTILEIKGEVESARHISIANSLISENGLRKFTKNNTCQNI
jgi:phage regulator Rha-like protein